MREEIKENIDKEAESYEVRQTALQWETEGLTLNDQLKEVDKIKDPEKAAALKKEVVARTETRDKIRDRQAKDLELKYWEEVKAGGPVPFGKVSGTVANSMLAYSRAVRSGFAEESDSSDLIFYGTLSDSDLAAIPLDQMTGLANSLTQEDYEAVFDRYIELRNGKGGGGNKDGKLSQIRTDSQMLKDQLLAIGVNASARKDGKPADPEAVELQNMFFKKFQEYVSDYERQFKRQPTPEEKQQFLDDQTFQVIVKDNFFQRFFPGPNNKKPLFAVKVEDIPVNEVRKIKKDLRQLGLPETEQLILETYSEKLRLQENGD